MRKPRRQVPTYPLGRELVRAAADALRIRSELPRSLARSGTRYFDAKLLIKAATRRRVQRALADLLVSGLPVLEGPEYAATVLGDALEDVIRWWDRAAGSVNELPRGIGHERLGMLPGVRLLALDLSLRLGALLTLCGADDDLEIGGAAGRGRLFWFVVSSELQRAGLRGRDLRPPNAPTRNGWRAWEERGILPRSRNVRDLPEAFVAAGWKGDAAALRARLRLAVALDELHAWAAREIDAEYAAGLTRFVVEVCRLVRQQRCPEPDETRWRKRLWDVVRTGARAEDARFPLQVLASVAEPAVGFEGVALRRGPSSILVRWAVVLAGATPTSSDLGRSLLRPAARHTAKIFERAASRALRPKPPGYSLPGDTPAAPAGAAALEARYWAEELLGAFREQRRTAAELVSIRPRDLRASFLEARALRLCGDAAAAEARFGALAERRRTWPAPLVEIANIAIQAGSFARAAELLERARRLGAGDNEVLLLLASTQMLIGSRESARRLLSKILERAPMHATAAALMALCCASGRERRREARRWAKHAARLGNPDALEMLEMKPGPKPTHSSPATDPPSQPDGTDRPTSGAFMFTLTPMADTDAAPTPWRPNWRSEHEER